MKKLLTFFLLLIVSAAAFAQAGLIKGRVLDGNSEPVVGAVIYYDGTNVSAVTNAKGEYQIEAQKGKDLVFSCFGFKEQKIRVAGQTKLDVTMSSDVLQLEEAMVIGYGTTLRQDFTGSIASVKSDEITKAAQSNLMGSLQGQVAGLSITSQSGEPGAGYNIKIRGNNSINASTAPLIVVDGMQMDMNSDEGASYSMSTATSDPLAFLNPSDIKSVEVLKDASATAIYGSRGANGVILITTKGGSGTSGKTLVTLDAQVGISQKANDIQMLDGQEWINYRFERGDYSGREYFGKDTDGDGINDTPKTLEDYKRQSVNWRDEMFRTAVTQNYNVAMRGTYGQEKKTSVVASIGWLDQQGIIKNNSYKRLTGQIKIDHAITKKVRVGATANFARMQSDGAASSTGGSFNNYGMTQMIYLEKPIEKFVDPANPNEEYTASTTILDCINDKTYRKGVSNRIIGNVFVEWKIIPDLTFRASATGNVSYAVNQEFYSKETRWGRSRNGVARYNDSHSQNYTANMTLTYRHTWQKNHNFDAMLGGELSRYRYNGYDQQSYDFEDETLKEYSLPQGTLMVPTMTANENSRMSTFGRVNYNYKYRYYITANMRADGSSRFSAGSRVGYFPSLSAAWRINREDWMRRANQKWLDNLKIRASAGISGNDRITNYSNLSTIDKVYYANDGKQILGMAESTYGNPNLKWETTYQYDLGIDFTVFGGRIDLTADVYYKDTRDMLFKAALPSQMGFTTQWQNIGRVENKGLEIALKTLNIKQGDFTWNTNLTFSLNRNKILDLGDGVTMMANNVDKGVFKTEPTRLLKDQPIGIIWGYVWDGNYQLDDFNIFYKNTGIPVTSEFVTSQNYDDFDYVLKDGVTSINGTTVKPGDRKYKDLDGDKVIMGDEDRQVIGNCYPDFNYGFGNTFSWKGLSLYIFFEGVQGRDLLNEWKARSTSGEGNSTYMYNITADAYYGAWRPENGSNNHARLKNQLACQQPVSSYYVEDASYCRFKTLALSYSLSPRACRVIHFQGLKFTFTCDNLCTWTKYTGLDPDVSSTNSTFPGLDRLTYPSSRTFSFGINATF